MGSCSSKSSDPSVLTSNAEPGRSPVQATDVNVKETPNDIAAPEINNDKGVLSVPQNIQSSVTLTPTADFKPIHSTIRWGKSLEEVSALVTTKESAECEDSSNGNRPIHIAAQNGHSEIVLFLISKAVDVNARNKKGNTALHMAVSYDYYPCVLALIEAGADKEITNDSGFPAEKGLEGDKSIPILSLMSASSGQEALAALSVISESRLDGDKDKANLVAAGLNVKKQLKEEWTEELMEKFKSILNSL